MGEVTRYKVEGPERTLFILDTINYTVAVGEDCGELHPALVSEGMLAGARILGLRLYMDDQLWELSDDESDWEPMLPIERDRCLAALFNLDHKKDC